MFTQHFADEHSTAIYFLVRRGDFSALHRLSGPEVYHFYSGDPLQMLLLHSDGTVERPILGVDLTSGQRPSVSVSGGVWQGSETTGEWSLLGATMAPGFRPEMFELLEQQGVVVSTAVTEVHAATGPDIGWGKRPAAAAYVLLSQVHYLDNARPVMFSLTYFIEGRFTFSLIRTR